MTECKRGSTKRLRTDCGPVPRYCGTNDREPVAATTRHQHDHPLGGRRGFTLRSTLPLSPATVGPATTDGGSLGSNRRPSAVQLEVIAGQAPSLLVRSRASSPASVVEPVDVAAGGTG